MTVDLALEIRSSKSQPCGTQYITNLRMEKDNFVSLEVFVADNAY